MGQVARQVANPGIAAFQLARDLAPFYGVTWNRELVTSDAFGGGANVNRFRLLLRNPPDAV